MRHVTFRAMGCQMLAMLDDERAASGRVLACVPHWFATWEQHLSRFRSDSELSVLNRDGYLRSASPVLWTVLQLALAQARRTEGLVTPTLLDALEVAGYDRSFEALLPQMPAMPVKAPGTRQGRAWESVRFNPVTRGIQLSDDVRLDLGGSAKGWAVDEAVRRLAAYGPALVDAGGDIAVSGAQADGLPWPIGVANPRIPDEHIDLVLLAHGGVATSGRDHRRWQRNGTWQHHIIDPRTMQPAVTNVLSATVLGSSAVECEAAAKVALLLGSHAGLAWLEERPSFAGLLILEDGTVLHSSRLAAHRWQTTESEGRTV